MPDYASFKGTLWNYAVPKHDSMRLMQVASGSFLSEDVLFGAFVTLATIAYDQIVDEAEAA